MVKKTRGGKRPAGAKPRPLGKPKRKTPVIKCTPGDLGKLTKAQLMSRARIWHVKVPSTVIVGGKTRPIKKDEIIAQIISASSCGTAKCACGTTKKQPLEKPTTALKRLRDQLIGPAAEPAKKKGRKSKVPQAPPLPRRPLFALPKIFKPAKAAPAPIAPPMPVGLWAPQAPQMPKFRLAAAPKRFKPARAGPAPLAPAMGIRSIRQAAPLFEDIPMPGKFKPMSSRRAAAAAAEKESDTEVLPQKPVTVAIKSPKPSVSEGVEIQKNGTEVPVQIVETPAKDKKSVHLQMVHKTHAGQGYDAGFYRGKEYILDTACGTTVGKRRHVVLRKDSDTPIDEQYGSLWDNCVVSEDGKTVCDHSVIYIEGLGHEYDGDGKRLIDDFVERARFYKKLHDYNAALEVSAMWTCGPKPGEVFEYKVPGMLGMTTTYKDENPTIRGFVACDLGMVFDFYTLQEAVPKIFNVSAGFLGSKYKYSVDDVMAEISKLYDKLSNVLSKEGKVPDVDASNIGFLVYKKDPSLIITLLVPLFSRILTPKQMEEEDVGWWPENQIRRFIEESRS